jgi:hypothetical protein
LPLPLLGLIAVLSRSAPADPAVDVGSLRFLGAVQPRLSPDGQSVAFSYQGGIWRLPVAGGTMRRLAAGVGFAVEPCWSPDGQRIAFLQGSIFTRGRLHIIDANSGKDIALPKEVTGVGKLYFGPDGKTLFGLLRSGPQLEALRQLDLTTGTLTSLVKEPVLRSRPWSLSPDGRAAAYVTTLDRDGQQGGNDGTQCDVWKVPVGGGEPVKLFRFPARIYDLCWAADGQSLIVTTDLGTVHNDLWQVRLNDPERPTKLTFGQADEDRASLSADGRWLLYYDNRGGAPALVLRDQRTGTDRYITVNQLDFGAPTGRLKIDLRDGQSPATARVVVRHADGSSYAPPGALWRIYKDYGHFHVRGSVELDVPAGTYTVRAHHGPEYRIARTEVEVKAGADTTASLSLERWADPNAQGWYSGDNHIHANYGYGEYYNNPAAMADFTAGEALNVGNFMVANSDGEPVFDREFFRGRPDPLSTPNTILYWNEEWRSTVWGHMTLVNLQQVVEPIFLGFAGTTNPHDVPSVTEIAERTRRQGGLVNYTHPAYRVEDPYSTPYAAKGLPVFAALGKIDTMDVMGSGDQASSALYGRLLNCGVRLSASAGTDVFLNRILCNPPGTERAYVKVDGKFDYKKWIDGLRAGRSFVSNGPLLELTVGGKSLGETLSLSAAGQVNVKGSVSSQYPLDRIEVLYNNRAVATVMPTADLLTINFDKTINVDRSGWIALRVIGPARDDIKGPTQLAHTSPIYVTVGDQPVGSADDARYFLAWIDRLNAEVRDRDRIPDAQLRADVQAQMEQARAFYRKILDRN